MKKILAIGVSTGGPGHLDKILSSLRKTNLSIIIAQHIDKMFLHSLASRLCASSGFEIVVPESGCVIEDGIVYLISKNSNIIVDSNNKLIFDVAKLCGEHSPNIDEFFESIALINRSKYQVLGVLLTGIGDDGAKGLLSIKNRGFKTIAENQESAIVYGMPRVAAEIGAADLVLNLKDIISEIKKFKNDE